MRLKRRIITWIVIFCGCGVTAAPLAAHVSYYFRANNVNCAYETTGATVTATAPHSGTYGNVSSWYGGRETVYWRSQLQMYRYGRWYVANNRMPWLKGVANAAGVLPFNIGGTYYWVDSRTNQILEHHAYVRLPHGIYRVEQFVYWPSSRATRAFYGRSYNHYAAGSCRL